ncbi:hypothetical protein EBB07_20745 [Paenibacillaceae bacterium]|nr:hypothetical protein EBB07_20745 [Paenibacillaceae bacterium]
MEWNFLFRIDYLKEHGEERNLKGVIFTEHSDPPELDQIQDFLRGAGYPGIAVQDSSRLLFADHDPINPIEIRIVKLGNEEDVDNDEMLRLLAKQFMRPY